MRVLLGFILIGVLILVACTPTEGTVAEDECSSFKGLSRDNCHLENLRCSKISSATMRDSCVVELAKVKEDRAVCDLIQGEKTKAYCYEQIAELKNDHILCYDVEDEYWQNNCHYHLAVAGDNHSFCSLISRRSHLALRHRCFSEIAEETNNAELCEELRLIDRDVCVAGIATETNNLRLCDRLWTPAKQDSCKLRIARNTMDSTICDRLTIDLVREDCVKFFEENQSEEN